MVDMAGNTNDEYRPRIALYGHDTQGLGHLRRNLKLSAGLAADLPEGLGADVLIVTGAAEVGMFELPAGVEAIVMPGVRKDATGSYGPRRLRGYELGDVVDLRAGTIAGALEKFAPEVFVVDKAPWGFAGELTEVLRDLRARGTHLVLGLRDVLDDPAVAAREWRRDQGDRAVRELYDEVWVYGDPRVHDVTEAANMAPDVRAKVRHIGYVSSPVPELCETDRPVLPAGCTDFVLVTMGGGQDGVEAALAALSADLPERIAMIVVAGPQMSPTDVARLENRAAERADGRARVVSFTPHAYAWLAHARAAITMGGANTVTEVCGTSTPALVVPRMSPRLEQWERAQSLARLDYLEVLEPGLATPSVISHWLSTAVHRRVDRGGLDMGGVRGARDRVDHLLTRRLTSFPRELDTAPAHLGVAYGSAEPAHRAARAVRGTAYAVTSALTHGPSAYLRCAASTPAPVASSAVEAVPG